VIEAPKKEITGDGAKKNVLPDISIIDARIK
jgi:hypothetical protein